MLIDIYFNSIKVRLEPTLMRVAALHPGFQFHKGTIRTTEEVLGVPMHAPFQFHKGTIRTICRFLVVFLVVYFNSIKVRLEHSSLILRKSSPSFQFHKGTIRTTLRYEQVDPGTEFQFHKGTIRTQITQKAISAKIEFQFHKGTIRTVFPEDSPLSR